MDFFDLASRMSAGLDGVRACLILSDDGLTLASYPTELEDRARETWDRLAQIGDPQRGFLDLGDEVWAVVRRGPYTAVVVSAPTVRPGLLLDRIESHLRVAEDARVRESTSRGSAKPEVVRRPRTSLHREAARQELRPLREEPATAPKAEEAPPTLEPSDAGDMIPEPEVDAAEAARKAVIDLSGQPVPEDQPQPVDPLDVPLGGNGDHPPAEEEAADAPEEAKKTQRDVDRVALAREFSKLISESRRE
jgi:hypothetical protein